MLVNYNLKSLTLDPGCINSSLIHFLNDVWVWLKFQWTHPDSSGNFWAHGVTQGWNDGSCQPTNGEELLTDKERWAVKKTLAISIKRWHPSMMPLNEILG